MKFDPDKPAAEMTAAELMTAHIAMGMPEANPSTWVRRTKQTYAELNGQMGTDEEPDVEMG